jgi:proteasome assembly chaperone (PAC2) family protein
MKIEYRTDATVSGAGVSGVADIEGDEAMLKKLTERLGNDITAQELINRSKNVYKNTEKAKPTNNKEDLRTKYKY